MITLQIKKTPLKMIKHRHSVSDIKTSPTAILENIQVLVLHYKEAPFTIGILT
jgi:hypothetical protein